MQEMMQSAQGMMQVGIPVPANTVHGTVTVVGLEADREPRNNTSTYRGVSFDTKAQKWRAQISVEGKCRKLGTFTTPEAAALRYDEVAKTVGRTLNLPPDFVLPPQGPSAPPSPRRRKEGHGTSSKYKGVSWYAASGKWVAQIRIDGKKKGLGLHETEEAAARKYDEHASYLGRGLNFPTNEGQCKAVKGGSNGGSSKYRGVSWSGKDGKWRAAIKLDGKTTYLGRFDSEIEAAQKYDEHAGLKGWSTNFGPAGDAILASSVISDEGVGHVGSGDTPTFRASHVSSSSDSLGFGIDIEALSSSSSSIIDGGHHGSGHSVLTGGGHSGNQHHHHPASSNMMMMLMPTVDDTGVGHVGVLDSLSVTTMIGGVSNDHHLGIMPEPKRAKADHHHIQCMPQQQPSLLHAPPPFQPTAAFQQPFQHQQHAVALPPTDHHGNMQTHLREVANAAVDPDRAGPSISI